jgi:hypothetical protein
MNDATYSKQQLLELSGMGENNLAYATKLGYIAPLGSISRGKRPRYSMDEVLKAAIMEKARALRVPYEKSSVFVDLLRDKSQQDEAARRGMGQPFVAGFWNVIQTRLDDQHVVWLMIKDDEPVQMFLWRRPGTTSEAGEFARMAAIEACAADEFEHYVILNIGRLIRRIRAAAAVG